MTTVKKQLGFICENRYHYSKKNTNNSFNNNNTELTVFERYSKHTSGFHEKIANAGDKNFTNRKLW